MKNYLKYTLYFCNLTPYTNSDLFYFKYWIEEQLMWSQCCYNEMVINLHNNWSHKQERVLRKEQVMGRNRDCTRQEAFDVGSAHWNSQHTNTQTLSRETLFGFVDRPWDVSISFWPGIELSLNICSKPTDVCE